MTTRTDFAKYLTRFLSEYLPHQRNVSKNTIASYRDSFVQFINYMKDINGIPVERLLLKHLTRDNVINYLQSFPTRRSSDLYNGFTILKRILQQHVIIDLLQSGHSVRISNI